MTQVNQPQNAIRPEVNFAAIISDRSFADQGERGIEAPNSPLQTLQHSQEAKANTLRPPKL